MPVSSVSIGCCTDYTVAGKCTVDGKDNKEDKTREEADMTFSPFFSKSVQSGPKLIQKMGNSKKALELWIWTTVGHFWTLLDHF